MNRGVVGGIFDPEALQTPPFDSMVRQASARDRA
jgi:hypothetical protein